MVYALIDCIDKKWIYRLNINSDAEKINIFLPMFKEKYSDIYAKKVVKILNKFQISNMVVNQKLLKNQKFCERLLVENKKIITGRKMYKTLLMRVLKDISIQLNVKLEKLKLVFLTEEYSVENLDLIRWVAPNVKSLSIVTTDKDKFLNLSEELYKKFGIVLRVYEKDKTNFKYAHILVNIDFLSNDMEKINMSNKSVVIPGDAFNYKIKSNFEGILIRKIDIISKENTDMSFDDLAVCEAKVYSSLRRLKENDRAFEMNGYRINGYFGENGKILAEEFKKLGKNILDK